VPDGDHAAINDLAAALLSAEAAAIHLPWLRERARDYAQQTRSRLLVGLAMPATLYVQAARARSRLLEDMLRQTFSACDVLHIPVLRLPVPTGAETDVGGSAAMPRVLAEIVACTRPINFLGLPAVSVPIGLSRSGLPIGMQLVGRPFEEQVLLRMGGAYEAAAGGFPRPQLP